MRCLCSMALACSNVVCTGAVINPLCHNIADRLVQVLFKHQVPIGEDAYRFKFLIRWELRNAVTDIKTRASCTEWLGLK